MCFLPGRPRFSSQSIVFRTVRSRKWITIKKACNHINQIDGPHLIQRPTGVKKRKWFYNWKRWRFIIGAQLLAWLISLQAQNAMTKNASLWIVQSLITFFPKKIRTFFLKWCRKFSQPTSIFNVINSYPWSFPFCQFVYNGNPFCLVFRFSANEMVLFLKIAWTIACQFAICCLPLADIRSKRHYQSHASHEVHFIPVTDFISSKNHRSNVTRVPMFLCTTKAFSNTLNFNEFDFEMNRKWRMQAKKCGEKKSCIHFSYL